MRASGVSFFAAGSFVWSRIGLKLSA